VGTIVVGIEDSLRGQDAVSVGGDIARASGAEVLAVCAYPYDNRVSAHFNPVMRSPLREAADATLARLCEPLSDLATVHPLAVEDPSPARALLAAAVATQAELIVIGSSHAGFSGQVVPGSTAARLFEGAPCTVAIAPQGHRLRPHSAQGRVLVGYDGSPTAAAALTAGARLAAALGAGLRVLTVFAPDVAEPPWLHVPAGYLRLTDEAERDARSELEQAAERVGGEAVFVVGDPVAELVRASEAADWLLLGSRNYGPEPAVLLGGVSSRVLERAACPVLVVPHGVASPLAGICGKLRMKAAA
jgi:nucleotide-binding universal stress UspA family protein